MKFKVTRMVVDADIARSAGLSEHPVSSSSRAVLRAIGDSAMQVAFCPELRAEWDRHQSQFARKWRAKMVAEKRVVRIGLTGRVAPAIHAAALSDAQKALAVKDVHLVDLALACDRCITSNDSAARAVFCLVACGEPALEGLIWAVPVQDHAVLAGLIADGGYVPEPWLLRLAR